MKEGNPNHAREYSIVLQTVRDIKKEKKLEV
jgi:hypothetical protein